MLLLVASPAMAWSCRHGFAQSGDTRAEVRQKCGAPDFIYPDKSRGGSQAADERWYYNPGSGQLLRVLRFQRGVLADITTAGYGFKPATRRCTPADIRYGMSVYELAARCGKPKNKRMVAASGHGGKHARGIHAARTEIWTYDFGAQYLLHKVTLVDAQVNSVETTSRKH
jgi:hypothetical protein